MPRGFRKDGSKLGFQPGHKLAPSGENHRFFGKKSVNYKHGKTKQDFFCVDCGVKVSTYTVKRCKPCSANKIYKEGKSGINKNNIGENNPNYRGGNRKCLGCGKEIKRQFKRCMKCKSKMELNANWQGGISFDPYPIGWNKEFKSIIRSRDRYECKMCGILENKLVRKLNIHHIDYIKDNLNINNLISLCTSCHAKTHFNRKYWIEYFKPMQEKLNATATA